MVTFDTFTKMAESVRKSLEEIGVLVPESEQQKYMEAKNRVYAFIIQFQMAHRENDDLKKALALMAEQVADFAERAGYLTSRLNETLEENTDGSEES